MDEKAVPPSASMEHGVMIFFNLCSSALLMSTMYPIM